MDAAFKFNRYEMCMIFMGFSSLAGRYHPVVYGVERTENQAAYSAVFKAARSTVFMLLKHLKDCRQCELCDRIQAIKAQQKMIDFLASDQRKKMNKLVMNKFIGDCQDMAGNFVRETLKLSYGLCADHATAIARKR